MKALNIRHAGITVIDLDDSIEWYSKIFDMKLLVRKKMKGKFIQTLFDDKNFHLEYAKLGCVDARKKQKICPCLIELYQLPNGYDNGHTKFNHIAITVDDVDAVYKRLTDMLYNGLIHSKPQIDEEGRNKLFFCNDDSFNLLEIVQELK